jgi:hypothetical protein
VNAIQLVARAIAVGAVKRPLAVDIVLSSDEDNTKLGMMHPTCTQHLPDEGWEYLGRAVLDMDRMQHLFDEDGAQCDWCGFSLYRRVQA